MEFKVVCKPLRLPPVEDTDMNTEQNEKNINVRMIFLCTKTIVWKPSFGNVASAMIGNSVCYRSAYFGISHTCQANLKYG
jgi:hypothetical protein